MARKLCAGESNNGGTRRFGINRISGRMQGIPDYLQNDREIRALAAQIAEERRRKARLEEEVREAEQRYFKQCQNIEGGGPGQPRGRGKSC